MRGTLTHVRSPPMPELRITPAVAVVLKLMLADRDRPRYGYELMRETGFASGKLYPLLARLCHAGWLSRESEGTNPTDSGRPPRVFYRLSPSGVALARQALAELHAQSDKGPVDMPLRWQPAGGNPWP